MPNRNFYTEKDRRDRFPELPQAAVLKHRHRQRVLAQVLGRVRYLDYRTGGNCRAGILMRSLVTPLGFA